MSSRAAAGSAVPIPETEKKKSRPNPARRKTAKAKAKAASHLESPKSTQNGRNVGGGTAVQSSDGQRAGLKPPPQPSKPKSNNIAPVQQEQPSSRSKSNIALTKPPPKPRNNPNPDNPKPPPSNSPKPSPLALPGPAMVTGGLLGCAAGAAVILGASMWKNLNGVESAILTARSAKFCIDNLLEEIIASLNAGTYNAPEALDMLRRTTLAYAASIPGGAPFVVRVFREVDLVRRQRGHEVDRVLAEACAEVRSAGERGTSSTEMHSVVLMQLMKLSGFASRATQDVLDRNPMMRRCWVGVGKALERPHAFRVPTVKLNMIVRHKRPTVVAA